MAASMGTGPSKQETVQHCKSGGGIVVYIMGHQQCATPRAATHAHGDSDRVFVWLRAAEFHGSRVGSLGELSNSPGTSRSSTHAGVHFAFPFSNRGWNPRCIERARRPLEFKECRVHACMLGATRMRMLVLVASSSCLAWKSRVWPPHLVKSDT